MFLVTVGIYLPALNGAFVFDDRKLVVENRDLWEGVGFDLRVFQDRSTETVRTNFRPLRFASYKIDALLTQRFGRFTPQGDPEPFFFHLQNLLLHAFNTVLVGWRDGGALRRD